MQDALNPSPLLFSFLLFLTLIIISIGYLFWLTGDLY